MTKRKTRSEWLDLLHKCQNWDATCMFVLGEIEREMEMNRPQVTDQMVSRFLCWRLPATFNPDGGVSFDKKNCDPNTHLWPVGTNLFSADQARQMLTHCMK